MKKISLLVLMVSIFVTFSIGVYAVEYKESPKLAAQVEQGTLPAVSERLPENPVVVQPLEMIGEYGGELRTTMPGPAHYWVKYRRYLYEPLVRWKPDFSGLEPGLARRFEANEDATEFTLYLHKGVKWSDGELFTADDILFAYNDVLSNPDIRPGGVPGWLKSAGKAAKLTKIDDYTIKFTFSKPNSFFFKRLPAVSGYDLIKPAHYLSQFHPDYIGDNKVDEMIEEGSYDTWIELFNSKDSYSNVDRPTVCALKLVKDIGNGSRAILERNPYYWKVDPDHKQLPYLDRLVFNVVDNKDVIKMKALAGEIDFQHLFIGDKIDMFSLLEENKDTGDYRLIDVHFAHSNYMNIFPNYNHKDPEMRKIFENKNFRLGLSHAINREEISELIFYGLTTPRQDAPNPDSKYYHEELAKKAIEYSPEKANQLLDKAGLEKKDADGFRLMPNGDPLEINVELCNFRTGWIDIMELIKGYWAQVGIRINIKVEDRTLYEERVAALEHDMGVWSDAAGSGAQVILGPKFYLPLDADSLHVRGYAEWFQTDGRAGVKPDPTSDFYQARMLYEEIIETPAEEKQVELMKKILDLNAENLWVIGICSFPRQLGVVKNDLKNVPQKVIESWIYPTPGPVHLEQFYWDK